MVALVTPIAGIVYVLDGVLIGAGDGRYLALAGLISLLAYVPLALTVRSLDAGLVWLWVAYGGFMLARMLTLVLRARTDTWIRTGQTSADVATPRLETATGRYRREIAAPDPA